MLKGEFHLGQDDKPISGVGRGIGLKFVETYFPEAEHTIRIASGYFQIRGYELSRTHIGSNVRLQILVSQGEGRNVTATLAQFVQEILGELGRTSVPLWDAVEEIVHRIDDGRFVIRGAWETKNHYRFHCKFYIMDDKCMWSGSANYTRPGLSPAGNEEQACLSRDPNEIKMFTEFYDKVIAKSYDLLGALRYCLKNWLDMALPFDAYLKTLHYWYGQETFQVGTDGHNPTYFQSAIIARGVRQIRDHHGALLLIATGLGKTVIGAEIARRVTEPYINKRIILLAPKGVNEQWRNELHSRNLSYSYFDNGLLFRHKSISRHHQITRLLSSLNDCDKTTIIVIDEAHRYRKMLQKDVSLRRHNRFEKELKFNLVKERIEQAINNGAKLLLLTATPYGTSRQDINSLLHLLPSPAPVTSVHTVGGANHWEIKYLDQLAKQPVVTILGMLHLLKMACQRGDLEEDGRIFIAMEGMPQKKYLPSKIILYYEKFQLFLQNEVQSAFAARVFEAYAMPVNFFNEKEDRTESGVADSVQNNAIQAWLSSPHEFRRVAKICSQIPDRKRTASKNIQMEMSELFPEIDEGIIEDEFDEDAKVSWMHHKAVFKVSQANRQKILRPLLNKLEKIDPENDDKFTRLRHILLLHAQKKQKVVIFVKRHTTAIYLVEMLKRTNINIYVGCTIQKEKDHCHLKSADQRKDIIDHFCPRSSNAKDIVEAQETDVLICTDADGIGINMQDACVVVNYDLPLGADELFQRAGRVLRMTDERDRVIHLYTFVPVLYNQTTQLAESITKKMTRLRERHDSSQTLVGGSILPDIIDPTNPFEIPLAYREDIGSLPANLTLPEEYLQDELNPDLMHRSALERHAQKAIDLPAVMLSAKDTTHHEPLVFVLLKHDNKHHLMLYAVDRQELVPMPAEEILELIQCDATAKKAIISPHIVEKEAVKAVEAWCQEKQLKPADCDHLCSIYLKPISNQQADLKDMLTSKTRSRI